MGRVTRAKAAKVAERLHIDEDAVLNLESDAISPAPERVDRAPLGEITPNSVGSSREEAEAEGDKSSVVVAQAQNKNDLEGRHTIEAQKDTDEHFNETDASVASPKELLQDVLPDEIEAAHSPASQAASDDLMRDVPELPSSHLPVHDIEQKTPESGAVRVTRKQLRFDNEGRVGLKEGTFGVSEQDPFIQGSSPVCALEVAKPARHSLSATKGSFEGSAQGPKMPNVLQTSPSMDSPYRAVPPADVAIEAGKDQSDRMRDRDAPYDKLEKAVVDASTPPRSSLKSPKIPAPAPTYDQLENAALQTSTPPTPSPKSSSDMNQGQDDPIDALDALEDAVEKINAEVPEVEVSPEKKAKKAPLVRTTKASQARISLAHGPKDNRRTSTIGKPRQSLAASRNHKRVTSISSTRSAQDATNGVDDEKKEVIIPHSKPRPMSMQFKPPPPPAKSTKAPTTSTFQLPGEAVAAKLKAAKEARTQKEAEEQKKKTFKARPAPSMHKTPAVRQTSTSKARESLMSGKPLSSAIGPKRPSSVATSRPMTTNRPSITPTTITTSAKTASTSKPMTSRNSVAASHSSTSLSIPKRPSTVMGALTNKPRASLASKSTPTGTASSLKPTPSSSTISAQTSGTAKGKAVFNRTGLAKSQEEKAKQEREAAAKKARAEAAERSRLLSREWAEKQKAKKAGLKPAVQSTVVEVNGEIAVDAAETF